MKPRLQSSRTRLSYRDRRSHKKKQFRFVGVVLLVLLFYILFSSLVSEPWVLNTDSMKPGYPAGSRLLVHPFWLRGRGGELKRPPQRGDLIALMPPYITEESWYLKVIKPIIRLVTFQKVDIGPLSRETWENRRVFKRVIGVPGDTVMMDGSVAYIKGEGEEFFISEFEMSGIGYDLQIDELPVGWTEDLPLSGVMRELTLKDGEFFVLGDNRSASNDSRYWGPVNVDNIRGKVIFSYWPFSSFGKPQ